MSHKTIDYGRYSLNIHRNVYSLYSTLGFKIVIVLTVHNSRIWKDMSLNDSLSEVERAKLAVWDYPVSDKYTKMWQAMKEARLPTTLDEAIERVKSSKSSSEGFAYLGNAIGRH